MNKISKLDIKEPKDPFLITFFMDKLKKSKVLKLNRQDEAREKAMNLAKKKFMSDKVEDLILNESSKEKIRERRLKLKRLKNHG